MTYEKFLKITLSLQKQDRILDTLYKNNVDLIEFVDPYHAIITELIEEVYGEEGKDWFSWFCYESDFGTKGIQAWDEKGKPICYSHESLWEFLEGLNSKKSKKKKK
jgi:hypothetical protein